jgi:hypothetical protein
MTPIQLPTVRDDRGLLGVIEGDQVPFVVRRLFWLSGIQEGKSRGHHAHRKCHQMIICLDGSVEITATTASSTSETFTLTECQALHITPMTWVVLTNFEPGTTVAVLADRPYDEDDYIRDFARFVELLKSLTRDRTDFDLPQD